eukprot:jgi/Tetstr1/457318/TSEL_043922.t1
MQARTCPAAGRVAAGFSGRHRPAAPPRRFRLCCVSSAAARVDASSAGGGREAEKAAGDAGSERRRRKFQCGRGGGDKGRRGGRNQEETQGAFHSSGARHAGQPPADSSRLAAVRLNKEIQEQPSVEALDALLRGRLGELDPIHLCTAASRLVALAPRHGPSPAALPPLLAALAGTAAAQVGDFSGRQLASLTWALARLGWDGPRGQLERLLLGVELAAAERLASGSMTRPTEVSLLAWSFARLGYSPDAFLGELEALPDGGRGLLARLRPQEVSNLAWALARLQRTGSPLLPPLTQRAVEVVRSTSRQELCVIVWAFAKVGHASPAVRENLMPEVASFAAPALHKFGARDLAMLAWGVGKLRVNTAGLLGGIAAESAGRLREFSPQGLSNLVWALARCGVASPGLMAPLADEVSERSHRFSPQGLANLIWGITQIGDVDCRHTTAALDALATSTAAVVPSLAAMEMSNVVWGLAKLGLRSLAIDHLLDIVAAEAGARGGEFSPQGLANLAWGFAKLGIAGDEEGFGVDGQRLLGRLSPHALRLSHRMLPLDISHLTWALARIGHYDAKLLDAMALRAAATLDAFSAQAIANTVWGLASLGKYSAPLLDAVAAAAPRRLAEFSNQGLVNLAWSFAQLDYVSPKPLFRAVAREADGRVGGMSPLGVASLVNSFADLYITDRRLFEAVDSTVQARLAEFKPQHAERLMTSYARLGYRSAAALPLLGQAAEGAIASAITATQTFGARQRWSQAQCMHYTALMVEVFTSGGLPNLPNLSEDIDAAWDDSIAQSGRDVSPRGMHRKSGGAARRRA